MDFEPRPTEEIRVGEDREWEGAQVIDIMRALREATQRDTAQQKELIASLPSLNEDELVRLNEKESNCPICLVPFVAVLCEEETASVNDSPASAKEDLGVTRLSKTCGHVFCRKDIKQWIQKNDSCPTCRTPFITREDNPGQAESNTSEEGALNARNRAIASDLQRMFRESGLDIQGFEIPGDEEPEEAEDNDQTHDFIGLYS